MRTITLALVLSYGCTNAAGSSGITASEVSCPPDSTLTYENFGKSFFADNCLSCHTSKDRPTLTSAAKIVANKQSIISAAVLSTKMPERASLSTDERALLGEWLSCGAP